MSLLPVDDALAAITKDLTPVSIENVEMAEAAASEDVIGRILGEDIHAVLNHPPHDVSAMDGYAVISSNLGNIPAKLTVIGESAAGHPFDGVISRGQAVRIFTGAYCPQGSDAIVIQEDTDEDNGAVSIHEAPSPGQFIRPKGNDFRQGALIAKKGDILTPRLLSLVASAGVREFKLYQRPCVAIISTGDELVAPGHSPQEGQIISSNGLFLKTYLSAMGADVVDLGIIPDEDDALEEAFERAQDADLIVTSGGASVGHHDGVAKAMTNDMTEDNETKLNFWRIAMRPGKPLIFGKINGVPMLGLPGNPVSTGVCAMVFVATALKTLSGQDTSQDWGLDIRTGILATPLKENDKRQDYLRATISTTNKGEVMLLPFEKQDSGMLKLLAEADALVIRPPFAPEAKAGDLVRYIPIPSRL